MWVKSQNCLFFSCHRNKIKCSRENLLVTLWLKQFIVVRIYQTNNRGKDPSISKILSSIHQSVYSSPCKALTWEIILDHWQNAMKGTFTGELTVTSPQLVVLCLLAFLWICNTYIVLCYIIFDICYIMIYQKS